MRKPGILAPSQRHGGGLAALLHRLSGLGLAVFLPFHFLALGLALEGEAALDGMLAWSEQPLVKAAELGLVALLALHLGLGLRVLALEWLPWTGLRKDWAAIAFGLALAAGLLAFARVL